MTASSHHQGRPTGEFSADGARIVWGIAPNAATRHELGRELLRGLLGESTQFFAICPACGGSHGPLRVRASESANGAPTPLVSVAYAGSLVVAGAAPPGAAAFGIDVELDTEDRRRAVHEAIGADGVRAWTRIEAVVKARGTGLRGDFAATRIEAAQPGSEQHWVSPASGGAVALAGFDAQLRLPGGASAILSVARA